MNALCPTHHDALNRRRCACRPVGHRAGFSITELLVVIGVIVLLVALLLVALNAVQNKAKTVKTQARMNQFSGACDSFQIDHGFYPGAVPEEVLAQDPQISGTENALLHLMGGVVREEDHPLDYGTYAKADGWVEIPFNYSGGTYNIKVNTDLMGEGPTIDGKPYSPYFTPGPGELAITEGQVANGGGDPLQNIPDLIDAWGQPIGYIRQVRRSGPLTPDGGNVAPQFYLDPLDPYLDSEGLGEFGLNQTITSGNKDYSILRGAFTNHNKILAQIIRHPGMGADDDPFNGTPRGAYYLFSAGADGIFFSRKDGPGSSSDPVDDITTLPPKVVEEYDDVVYSGGG